jgi:hypothetical protein
LLDKFATQVKLRDSVYIEQAHSRSSGRREADDAAVQRNSKVIVPRVLARAKEINAIAGGGVYAGEITRLMKIALSAAPT